MLHCQMLNFCIVYDFGSVGVVLLNWGFYSDQDYGVAIVTRVCYGGQDYGVAMVTDQGYCI